MNTLKNRRYNNDRSDLENQRYDPLSVPTVVTVSYRGLTRTFETKELFEKNMRLLNAVSEKMGWKKNLKCDNGCIFDPPESDHIIGLKLEEGGGESIVKIYADGNKAKLEAIERFWEEFRPADDVEQSYVIISKLLDKKYEAPSQQELQWTKELLTEMNSQLRQLKEKNKQLEEENEKLRAKEKI